MWTPCPGKADQTCSWHVCPLDGDKRQCYRTLLIMVSFTVIRNAKLQFLCFCFAIENEARSNQKDRLRFVDCCGFL